MVALYPPARYRHTPNELLIWKTQVDAKVVVSPSMTTRPNPLVVGDLVIASVFTPACVIALRRGDGAMVWRRDLRNYGGGSLAAANGVVYAHTSSSIVALAVESGEVRWEFRPYDKSETIYSSPVVTDDTVFVGDRRGHVNAVDAMTGDVRWSKHISSRGNDQVNATGVVVGDAFIGANNARLAFALDRQNGSMIWQRELDGASIGELLLYRGHVLLLTDRSMWKLDPATGEILRRHDLREQGWHSMGVAGEHLVIHAAIDSERGELIVMRGEEELARRDTVPQLQFHATSTHVYEARIGGLGILAPATGERLHDIATSDWLLTSAPPDVEDGVIYAMFEYGRERESAICALRHP